MTWSQENALEQRKKALRLLLDDGDAKFTRSSSWRDGSGISSGVWSLLLNQGLVNGKVVGGEKWRLTLDGWIEACRLLRGEVGLDQRFGILSGYLKHLAAGRTALITTVQQIAVGTGLCERWVGDAIEGQMAEKIYYQHGATVERQSGYVDTPPHVGNHFT